MSTPLPIHHHPNYLQIQHLAQQILTFSQPRIRSKTEDSCPLAVVPAVEYDALHRLACSLASALIENHPPRTCSITLTEKQWLSIEASLNTHPSNENPHGPGWSSPDQEDAVTHFNKALRQQLHPANAPAHPSIAVRDIIEKWNNEATLQEESASDCEGNGITCSMSDHREQIALIYRKCANELFFRVTTKPESATPNVPAMASADTQTPPTETTL